MGGWAEPSRPEGLEEGEGGGGGPRMVGGGRGRPRVWRPMSDGDGVEDSRMDHSVTRARRGEGRSVLVARVVDHLTGVGLSVQRWLF